MTSYVIAAQIHINYKSVASQSLRPQTILIHNLVHHWIQSENFCKHLLDSSVSAGHPLLYGSFHHLHCR